MFTSKVFMSFLTLIAGILVFTSPSSAFYDDICFTTEGMIANCLANATPNCSITGNCLPESCAATPTSEQNTECINPAILSFPNGGDPRARSMIHADSIYLLAQAVGLDPRVAYFIAAYGDTPDKDGQFILMIPSSNGPFLQYQDPQHQTIALPDLFRGSAIGQGIHFPLVTYVPEITFNPTDSLHEGVSRLRSWALGGRFGFQSPCLGGITFQDTWILGYFSGTKCYVSTMYYSFEGGLYHVNQTPDVLGFQTGDQPFQSNTPLTKIEANDAPVFAGDLQRILDRSPGRLADGLTPVPLALVQIGVYIHSLMDRASHTPALMPLRVTGSASDLIFNDQVVFPFPHAYLHFEEVGIPAVSARTEVALNLAYDELRTFAEQHPNFITSHRKIASQSDVVPPLVNGVLNQRSPSTRLTNIRLLATSLGYNSLGQSTLP
jgi:hypothetical protein